MPKGVKVFIVAGIWLVLITMCVVGYRYFYQPAQDKAAKEEEDKLAQQKLDATSGASNYNYNLRFALDSFSGYAVFRSQEFKSELRRNGILCEFVDDGADYDARLESLAKGETQLAVFTIDALITSSEKLGDIPATIVAIIDETRGADAMVGYKDTFPNVDALNHPDTKFVLTPNSPSETLARVLMAQFNLDQIGDDPFVEVNSAEEVYKKYRTSDPDANEVYVLWEPYVSKALENPNMHVILDSSRFRGYIVDVIVVNRDFLFKDGATVTKFVEAYLRAAYTRRSDMTDLVLTDARDQGIPVTKKQAENLVKGIWWKNTQENYAHLGLHSGETLQHIEDMILNLTRVLTKSGAITSDPTNGKPTLLYYDKILEGLYSDNFHPGISAEKIRGQNQELPPLKDADWARLLPVGTLEVPKLSFTRGTSRLGSRSHVALDELIEKLKTFPQYYVLVRGDSTKKGNIEANKKLALARAQAAVEYLIDKGVGKNRVRAEAVEPTGRSAVNFVLGEMPY